MKNVICWTSPPGFERTVHLGGVTLTAFRVPHAGAAYAGVEHYCFLLEGGGGALLVVADSDYLPEHFARMLAGRRVDAALVNPLFLNKREGRRTLLEGINPGCVWVYHLPFEGEDPMGLRRAARYDGGQYRGQLPPSPCLKRKGKRWPSGKNLYDCPATV